jgi:hypothetical protein
VLPADPPENSPFDKNPGGKADLSLEGLGRKFVGRR